MFLTAYALGGCGVTGELKTPPPLFGDKTKVPAESSEKGNSPSPTENGPVEDERELRELLEELER